MDGQAHTPSPWLAYVPRHTALDLLARPGADPRGRETRFPCVALFADVSGFTAMSEALGQSGRFGTEALTRVLNSYFEPMIALIESYGGIVGKFGGDALTVLFPYTARTRRAVARRALQCAVHMQANMDRYAAIDTGAGIFSLTMKAGLALGPVLCATVGDPELRLEALIAGAVLDACADAEHHATRGEVVVANTLLAEVGPVTVVEARGEFTCVAGLRRAARPAPLPQLAPPPAAAQPVFARFVHPSIAHRLEAGLAGFINEHRRVTVLFVSFAGLDYDHDPAAGAQLQAYFAEVIRAVHRYDGYLNKLDMGDKGSKYIVLFGTPVAHEDDEERAVRCALELSALPGPVARIGVNTGQAFCGEVGSEARKEYTVIGDAVNLAARLMQAARPGQILMSETTRRGAERAVEWEALPAITVKGKREPIPLFSPTRLRTAPAAARQTQLYQLPMVGRAAELAAAHTALRAAAAGQGQVLGLVGEAGLGKSRLTAEVVQAAEGLGAAVFAGACQSYGVSVAYLVWREVWRGFFHLDEAAPPAVQADQLTAALAALDPDLADRAPLLGVVLNLPLPENDLTRALDPQLRAELVPPLLLECLRRRTAQTGQPVVLVLEDCHWIDPLSEAVLEFIGRNAVDLPVMIWAAYRPEGAAPLAWGAAEAHVLEIRLAELPPAEAEALMALKLRQLWGAAEGDPPLPEAVARQLQDRAHGNPFYLEELFNYMHDRGLDPRAPEAAASLTLPDSLHQLILSRIDTLSEAAKTSLKVASVIGRVFVASWLWGSYPALGAPEAVRQQLADLSQLDLTPVQAVEPELEYIFKHITTQEVAYESLAYATRAAVHEAVGAYVEAQYPEQRDQYIDVLAFHFGRSQNADKQRVYFQRAGDLAKAAYANAAAEDYYRRLLPLLPPEAQAPVHLDLGEVWQLVGQWPEAEGAYTAALQLAAAHGQPALAARAQMALGTLVSRTDSYAAALAWYQQALASFEALGDQRGVGRVMEQLSFAYTNLGDFTQALACAERQLAIAAAHADPVGRCGALDYRGIALLQLGRFEEAQASLQQAVAEATAAGYRRGAAIAYNDLAGAFWMQDDYARALAELQHAIEVVSEIGYLNMLGTALGNAGLIYKQYGELTPALQCFDRAMQIALQLGDRPSLTLQLSNRALTLKAHGELDLAQRLLARAIALARELDLPDLLCLGLHNQAEVLPPALGRPLNQEALAIARQHEIQDVVFMATVLELRLAVLLGEQTAAAADAQLAALAADASEEQTAQIAYERWRLDPANVAHRDDAAERYQALYERTHDEDYRRRYFHLTGADLPPSPALPPLPAAVLEAPVSVAELLRRAGVEATN